MQTNFEPVKVTLTRDGAEGIALDATATSYKFTAAHEKAYTITAYYSDSEFIVSAPFYVTEAIVNAFTDVSDNNWFYNDVLFAVKLGLVNGKSATEYMPDDNLTYAEAIKLAACMHQLYTTGKITLKNGNPWYQTYADYCVNNGIIDKEYNYNEKATRAGYMAIFANALPDEALTKVNDVADGAIPDVPMMRAFAPGVYKLYRAGILAGSDAQHNCKPLANIKRSEVAAILARMMDESKRVKFTLGEVTDEKALTIKKQPVNVTAKTGVAVSFTVEAENGKAPYTYSWQVRDYYEDWEEIDVNWIGTAKQATLSFNVHQEEFENKYQYRCVITDANGDKVTSKTVNVTENTGGPKNKFEQTEKEDLKNEDFLMYVEDAFYITTRDAILAIGRVVKGKLNTGDSIIVVSKDGKMTKATVAAIEMFNKVLDTAEKGDNISLLFSNEVKKGMIERGDSIASIKTNYSASTSLKGTLKLTTKEEGGRASAISDGHSAQLTSTANDITCKISGIGTMNPGETKKNVTVTFNNFTGIFYEGQQFTLNEGGRVIGTFTVTEK